MASTIAKAKQTEKSGLAKNKRLLGESAEILKEDIHLVDMEEVWLEGPAVVDENEPKGKRMIFLI